MRVLVKRRPTSRIKKSLIHSTKTGSLVRVAQEHVVLTDTREKVPWNLAPFTQRSATLKTGDYQLLDAADLVAIERKGQGLSDLLGCIGTERGRFERELERLTEFQYKWVIVEGSWHDLCAGRYTGRIPPQSAIGSIATWQVRYAVPFLFTESRAAAEALAIRLLVNVCRDSRA